MNRRMDANRALKNLNKFRLHGKQITLAWAPGKGMKDKQWKDYWDVDIGCSYLPLEKVTTQVLTSLFDIHNFLFMLYDHCNIIFISGPYNGAGGRWNI